MYDFDSELAPMVELLPELGTTDVAESRAALDELIAPFNASIELGGVSFEDRVVPGYAGEPDVGVRVYQPANRPEKAVPGLLYVHGGGFTVGSVATEHAGAVGLCRELDVVVVSVDYRLAPEDPWPAGLDDCYSALAWFHIESDDLGVDRSRIGISGASAGGGLCASLALLAKERGGPGICFQYLGIPELDDRLDTPSMRAFIDTPLWNRPAAEQSWAHYLGDLVGGDVPITAAPGRATADDLSDLPPAYISTMQFDPLHDEGILYAMRLLEAGVNVELHSYPQTFHGSTLVATAQVHRREQAEQLAVLRRGLGVVDPSRA